MHPHLKETGFVMSSFVKRLDFWTYNSYCGGKKCGEECHWKLSKALFFLKSKKIINTVFIKKKNNNCNN